MQAHFPPLGPAPIWLKVYAKVVNNGESPRTYTSLIPSSVSADSHSVGRDFGYGGENKPIIHNGFLCDICLKDYLPKCNSGWDLQASWLSSLPFAVFLGFGSVFIIMFAFFPSDRRSRSNHHRKRSIHNSTTPSPTKMDPRCITAGQGPPQDTMKRHPRRIPFRFCQHQR